MVKKNISFNEDNSIKIRGARQHNLKNVDLTLPRNKFIVFTGVSGSGKSSLAFDTIFAEVKGDMSKVFLLMQDNFWVKLTNQMLTILKAYRLRFQSIKNLLVIILAQQLGR